MKYLDHILKPQILVKFYIEKKWLESLFKKKDLYSTNVQNKCLAYKQEI